MIGPSGNPYLDGFRAYKFTWLRQSDAARALGTKTPNIAVMIRRGLLSACNINGFVYVSLPSIEMYLDRQKGKIR